MITTIVVLFVAPFFLILGFGMLAVGRLWVKDPECPKWLSIALHIGIVALWITDPLFNWTWANLIFRGDYFRKVTFSTRINYYFEQRDKCPNIRKRNLWARLLNLGVEGHIDTKGEDISPGHDR